jgi:putative inorganic carbon (HCO3(-)) transporter
MNDIIGSITAVLICVPALVFALQRSSWLVDYLFFVLAFNRGIRRVIDYQNGQFNQYSWISLTPIIVGGLAVAVVVLELNRSSESFSHSTIKCIKRYGLAVALAFMVGLYNARFAAVYALGDFIAPIGLLGFGSLYANRTEVIDRWCNSIALTGLLVAIYGIYQFYTIPPWDAFWVRAVEFEGYLGELAPTKMTLFSTLAERGPAASYLCNCLIIVLLRPKTLLYLKIPAVLVITVAMMFTYVRTAVIQVLTALILYPLVNRGVGRSTLVIVSVVTFALGELAAQSIPGAAQVTERLSTLSNIHNDGSFRGRISIIGVTFAESLREPWGIGIGSHGVASRVGQASISGSGDSSGYVEVLRTFGWIGFLLVVSVFWVLWVKSRELIVTGIDDKNIFLFRAWFISALVASFSGNLILQPIFFWVLAGYCLEQADEVANYDEALDVWEPGNNVHKTVWD